MSKWKVYHLDWPEDIYTYIVPSFRLAKSKAWSMDHEFKSGKKQPDGSYVDSSTGIVIEPIKDKNE